MWICHRCKQQNLDKFDICWSCKASIKDVQETESNSLFKGVSEKVNTDGKPVSISTLPIVTKRKCPFCAEEISSEAIKCKHCGEFLTDELRVAAKKYEKQTAENSGAIKTVITIIIAGALATSLLKTCADLVSISR